MWSHGYCRLHTEEGKLKEHLWTLELLIVDGDQLPIRQLLALLQVGGGCRSGHLQLEVQGDIVELLLDVMHISCSTVVVKL